MILENSKILRIKINVFKNNFLNKKEVIIFEENKFDIFIGFVFRMIVKLNNKLISPMIKHLSINIKSILEIFGEILAQKKDLKQKINDQEKIILQSLELSSKLSTQMNILNKKFDDLEINVKKDDNKEKLESIIPIENTNFKSDINISESQKKIEFFQEENTRISKELYETRDKFDIIKNEITKLQDQRSSFIKKINSVNDVLKDSNIVTNVFENEIDKDKINIIDTNKKIEKKDIDLNLEIKNIFSK
jgi:hypothetical protein